MTSFDEATRRSPVTANSRTTMTIATHADTRSSSTSAMSAQETSTLSASGSMNLPKFVT